MISFIVIGKNEGWRLEQCLSSIHRTINIDNILQYELIYVDSKSIDNSIDLAKQYGARTFLIIGECNAAIARNIGATEAKGDILFFIDGDMQLLPGFLPQVLINNQATLIYPFLSGLFSDEIHDENWNYLRTSYRHKPKVGEPDVYECVTGGLFLITKALWNKVGGMDNRLKCNEDYDLGLRLTKLGFPLCRKSILMAKHYMVDYTLRSNYVTNMKYTALLLRKHWNNSQYLSVFCKSRYTSIALIVVLFVIWLWQPIVLLWLGTLLYKTLRSERPSFTLFGRLMACDFYFWGAFWGYCPKLPIANYKKM